MKTSSLNGPDFKQLTAAADREAGGIFTGDLLSYVMSRLQGDDIWVTIMKNVNVAAVASLCDAAAVIVAGGTEPDAELLEKAEENGINVFSTGLSAAEAVIKVHELMTASAAPAGKQGGRQ